jgi:hypothetical protein
MTTSRFFVNNKRISTAVHLNDGTILQVFPSRQIFENLQEWEDYWRGSRFVSPRVKIETSERKASGEIETTRKSWTCPACGLGPGNDHRMCICRAFNYSVQAWEKACGIRG